MMMMMMMMMMSCIIVGGCSWRSWLAWLCGHDDGLYSCRWLFLEILGSLALFGAMTKLCYCRWVFLEILGSLALFGVMMIDASSRRMEMAMCHITVFSGQ